MGEETLSMRFKRWVSSWAWPLFLWSISRTANDYWDDIYRQEKYQREPHPQGEGKEGA